MTTRLTCLELKKMLDFKLGNFDAEFLMNMLDYGFEVSKYPYESSVEGNRLTASFGEYSFSFTIESELYEPGNWEELAAKRAAWQVRDKTQTFDRMNEVMHIHEYLDKKYSKKEKNGN